MQFLNEFGIKNLSFNDFFRTALCLSFFRVKGFITFVKLNKTPKLHGFFLESISEDGTVWIEPAKAFNN